LSPSLLADQVGLLFTAPTLSVGEPTSDVGFDELTTVYAMALTLLFDSHRKKLRNSYYFSIIAKD